MEQTTLSLTNTSAGFLLVLLSGPQDGGVFPKLWDLSKFRGVTTPKSVFFQFFKSISQTPFFKVCQTASVV
jgi:hypothetical protein